MNQHIAAVFAVAFGLTAAAGSSHGAEKLIGDAARGKELSVTCMACHMEDGSGQENPGAEAWPRLAGLNATYISRELHTIKSGSRTAPTMKAFADMLDAQGIEDVAAFFSEMPIPPTKPSEQKIDPKMLALGEKLALRGDWDRFIPSCVSCHGPQLEGVGDLFPMLAGQYAHYVRKQLFNWQTGARTNSPKDLMNNVALRLNGNDIQAVAAWIGQQPAPKPPQKTETAKTTKAAATKKPSGGKK